MQSYVTRLWAFIAPHWKSVAWFFVYLVFNAAFGLVPAFLYGFAIDSLIRGNINGLLELVALYVFTSTISGVLRYGQNYNCGLIARNVGRDVSEALFRKIQRVPLDYFRATTTGEMITLIRMDVDNVTDTIYSQVMPFLSSVIIILSSAASMVAANWKLTLASLAIVPLWIATSYLSGRLFTPLQDRHRQLMDAHNAVITERLSMAGAIRAKSNLGYEQDGIAYRAALMPLFHLSERLINAYGVTFIASGFINALGPGLVLFSGVWIVHAHHATVGMLTAFMALQARLFGPIQSVVSIRGQLAKCEASLTRIFATLAMPDEPSGYKSAVKLTPIEFQDIDLLYENIYILKKTKFRIEPGEHVALVGESGAGKSTVAQMLVRLGLPSSGSIELAGVDIEDIEVDSLRKCLTYVPQDTAMFSGTLRENITYGADVVCEEALARMLDIVELSDKVRHLPNGLESEVGVGGFRLSGGERQRVAIARALLRPRPLYIFDEATSALDLSLERRILKRLRRELQGKTFVCISHRLGSLSELDRILVLSNGTICESGTYSDLISRGGRFAEMTRAATM